MSEAFDTLIRIMDRLRDPGGCPWDREQTIDTIRTFLLEETYEVLEALDTDDPAKCREELGDLLFQVVFISRLYQERGDFTVDDAARSIADKLVRRHPHVFGDAPRGGAAETLKRWEAIKRAERKGTADASALSGVPRELPSLLRAYRLGVKAALVGFDWTRIEDVWAKVDEEMAELRAAASGLPSEAAHAAPSERAREEVGDLLFAVANLARKLGIDPEDALRRTNDKFVRRFHHVERRLGEKGKGPAESTLEEMDGLWNEAKGLEEGRRG